MGRIAGVTPAETKERLVDAAVRVFELKGFEGATVSEIAREAGVSSGAIYAHYTSKAELLVDAIRVHSERVLSTLFVPGSRVEARSVLTTLADRLANRDREATALLAEALLGSRRDAELAQVLASSFVDRQASMAAMIADGQDRGSLAPGVSPEAAARFALMLGLGSLMVSELELPPVDQADWTAFVDRLMSAFAPEADR